jgi:hypothetical protein
MVFGLSITISILAASWRAGGGVAMFLLRHRAVGGIFRRVIVLKGKGIVMLGEIDQRLKRSGRFNLDPSFGRGHRLRPQLARH